MASERQIAANRRNAKKSTGPRSAAGRNRTSANAHRHGLRSPISSQLFADELAELTRNIAGPTTDQIAIEHARTAAQAELELGRIRRARLALIERACGLGGLEPPQWSSTQKCRWLIAMDKWFAREQRGRQPILPQRPTPPAMPTTEPERTSEAVRRVLPELTKFARYEARAAATRNKAIRQLSARLNALPEAANAESSRRPTRLATFLPNEPNF